MTTVRLSRDLAAQGYSYAEMTRMARNADLIRVRRGAYTSMSEPGLDPRVAHLQLLEATVGQSSAESVVSHQSAATRSRCPSRSFPSSTALAGSPGGLTSAGSTSTPLANSTEKVKYGRLLLKPGQSPQDALFEEKRREDLHGDLGWQVVRWTWADLHAPAALIERLHRAFARGRRVA